jgi:streptomycin 6-kinase
VELLCSDVTRGALLLERLDASRSLTSLALAEAGAIAGGLARTLAVETTGPFPSLPAIARRLSRSLPARQRSLGDPVPRPWVMLAARLAAGLSRDTQRFLVHTDLHYDNVLASGSRWVAIDPKPVIGAPERSVAELLWTRADELPGPGDIVGLLDAIVEGGKLDRARAIAWAFVRCADYLLWGLDIGLTSDPSRCQRIAGALASLAAQTGYAA